MKGLGAKNMMYLPVKLTILHGVATMIREYNQLIQ